ncbi:MAG: DegT/DnrJ/EryC1/StrS family aminotransferase [Kiritimatiellae bacterium]|nr:DegT/DnrJ/EryC1/StrS family aminotransferase [Kiritimatiellia bacterium]
MSKLACLGGKPIRTARWPDWPVWDEREIKALESVVRSGGWGRLYENSRVAEFEQKFAGYQDAKFGVAVTSGTAALTVGLKAVGVDIGDEVIVPGYTFIATATAAVQNNAVPVFVDVDLGTLNIDPDAIEAAITPRTRAIVPVHWAGRAADMDRILAIAARHKLAVVEDACHGWGASWKGRKLGAIGDLGAVSFQASKHMSAGEGGIILTNDEDLAAKCFSYHHIGRIAGRPFYEHHLIGWNFRMTEFQAAVLLVQLERIEDQAQRREENAVFLSRQLAGLDGISLLRREPYMTRIAWHSFRFLYDERAFGGVPRDAFVAALKAEGIPAGHGYSHPLYKNPVFAEQRFGRLVEHIRFPDYAGMALPNCERLCRESVTIGQTCLLGMRDDMQDIADAIRKVKAHAHELAGKPAEALP